MREYKIGYKAFNQDLTNRYGQRFEIGKIYEVEGKIKWGSSGNGFHMCSNMEDCFRYFDPSKSILTKVIGFGESICYNDEYFGYYDMYVCQKIKIIRIIERKEIIEAMLNKPDFRVERFLNTFSLTEEEREKFQKQKRKCKTYG